MIVVQTLALEFELCQEARQVVRWVGPSGRREFQQAVDHRGDFGDHLVVLVAAGSVHHRMEQVGIELPVV